MRGVIHGSLFPPDDSSVKPDPHVHAPAAVAAAATAVHRSTSAFTTAVPNSASQQKPAFSKDDTSNRSASNVSGASSQGTKIKSRSGPKSKCSPYIGVSQYKRTGRWEAHIWDSTSSTKGAVVCSSKSGKGKQLHLGSFPTAIHAAKAYDRAALLLRGPEAALNFPLEEYQDDLLLEELGKMSRQQMILALRKSADLEVENAALEAFSAQIPQLLHSMVSSGEGTPSTAVATTHSSDDAHQSTSLTHTLPTTPMAAVVTEAANMPLTGSGTQGDVDWLKVYEHQMLLQHDQQGPSHLWSPVSTGRGQQVAPVNQLAGSYHKQAPQQHEHQQQQSVPVHLSNQVQASPADALPFPQQHADGTDLTNNTQGAAVVAVAANPLLVKHDIAGFGVPHSSKAAAGLTGLHKMQECDVFTLDDQQHSAPQCSPYGTHMHQQHAPVWGRQTSHQEHSMLMRSPFTNTREQQQQQHAYHGQQQHLSLHPGHQSRNPQAQMHPAQPAAQQTPHMSLTSAPSQDPGWPNSWPSSWPTSGPLPTGNGRHQTGHDAVAWRDSSLASHHMPVSLHSHPPDAFHSSSHVVNGQTHYGRDILSATTHAFVTEGPPPESISTSIWQQQQQHLAFDGSVALQQYQQQWSWQQQQQQQQHLQELYGQSEAMMVSQLNQLGSNLPYDVPGITMDHHQQWQQWQQQQHSHRVPTRSSSNNWLPAGLPKAQQQVTPPHTSMWASHAQGVSDKRQPEALRHSNDMHSPRFNAKLLWSQHMLQDPHAQQVQQHPHPSLAAPLAAADTPGLLQASPVQQQQRQPPPGPGFRSQSQLPGAAGTAAAAAAAASFGVESGLLGMQERYNAGPFPSVADHDSDGFPGSPPPTHALAAHHTLPTGHPQGYMAHGTMLQPSMQRVDSVPAPLSRQLTPTQAAVLTAAGQATSSKHLGAHLSSSQVWPSPLPVHRQVSTSRLAAAAGVPPVGSPAPRRLRHAITNSWPVQHSSTLPADDTAGLSSLMQSGAAAGAAASNPPEQLPVGVQATLLAAGQLDQEPWEGYLASALPSAAAQPPVSEIVKFAEAGNVADPGTEGLTRQNTHEGARAAATELVDNSSSPVQHPSAGQVIRTLSGTRQNLHRRTSSLSADLACLLESQHMLTSQHSLPGLDHLDTLLISASASPALSGITLSNERLDGTPEAAAAVAAAVAAAANTAAAGITGCTHEDTLHDSAAAAAASTANPETQLAVEMADTAAAAIAAGAAALAASAGCEGRAWVTSTRGKRSAIVDAAAADEKRQKHGVRAAAMYASRIAEENGTTADDYGAVS